MKLFNTVFIQYYLKYVYFTIYEKEKNTKQFVTWFKFMLSNDILQKSYHDGLATGSGFAHLGGGAIKAILYVRFV